MFSINSFLRPITFATILSISAVIAPSHATLNGGPPDNGSAFDYLIVGGGTAGLVLANRLSLDPDTSVAVIEAGSSQLNNPNVTLVGAASPGLYTQIDWQYPSVPQDFADGTTLIFDAGKGLGGTSLINGMTYIRAAVPQIDSWESKFGNPGWNWTNLFPYYLKSETFQVPDTTQQQAGCNYIASINGGNGPVEVGWVNDVGAVDLYHEVRSAWEVAGIEWIPDPNSGNSSGGSVWPLTVSRSQNIRWDAARAYLFSGVNNITTRSNLQVYQNSLAQRIAWAPDTNGLAQAAGITVMGTSGSPVTVAAKREIILSAGSLKSPALLEASGVGNAAVLKAQNIPMTVELPSVGFNLQDQPLIEIDNSLAQNFTGYGKYVTFATANDLFGDNATQVEKYVRSQIPSYAQRITSRAAPNATSSSIQEQLLNDQADLIFKDLIPIAEILTLTAGSVVQSPLWNMLPFSRGSVHVNNSSPDATPSIDPNFYLADWDNIGEAAAGRLARKFLAQGRASGWVGREIIPGLGNVTADASDAKWTEYAKKYATPVHHPVGTTAMMAKELGGVVDCRLKVYGTNNVRVVDAGIFPAQVNGHLTSTIYAVAERAADIIMGKI